MKTGPAIAEILKREGVEYLFAYPVNHLIEHCAARGAGRGRGGAVKAGRKRNGSDMRFTSIGLRA